jgi:hypothetical protein
VFVSTRTAPESQASPDDTAMANGFGTPYLLRITPRVVADNGPSSRMARMFFRGIG